MVGDDPMRGALRAVGIDAGEIGAGADQGAKQVDVVVVVHALQHGGDALEPHAGVDRRARQVDPLAAGQGLELHEHQIPDLDEAVAVSVRRAGRPAGDMVPVIVENLRARAAGAGVAHRPEIVAGGDADDPLLGQAGYLLPQIERFVVVVIDGDGQLLRRQAEVARQQIPGVFDRMVLEIIAEREVAEHFEERVMARGIADIVEVVVLAAGAHALLRRRRPHVGALLDPGEHVLELDHPGVGEHERRIVARHERARRDDHVPVPGEELEEARSNFVDAAHLRISPEPDAARFRVLVHALRSNRMSAGPVKRNLSFPRTRESRAAAAAVSLDTRVRGYDGRRAANSVKRLTRARPPTAPTATEPEFAARFDDKRKGKSSRSA